MLYLKNYVKINPKIGWIYVPTLTGSDAKLKKYEIKRYFNFCYERYERLFDIVKDPKAFYQKADPLRHPIIFYNGHTAFLCE